MSRKGREELGPHRIKDTKGKNRVKKELEQNRVKCKNGLMQSDV